MKNIITSIMMILTLILIGYGLSMAQENKENSALQDAIDSDDINRVKSYLNSGADPNAMIIAGPKGLNVLIYAVMENRTEISKTLLDHGANVNVKIGGLTALIVASSSNNAELVKILLANKADINVQDEFGWTSLMRASFDGNIEIVNILLAHNADVNIKDNKNKTTALKLALLKKHAKIVELLKKAGAEESK